MKPFNRAPYVFNELLLGIFWSAAIALLIFFVRSAFTAIIGTILGVIVTVSGFKTLSNMRDEEAAAKKKHFDELRAKEDNDV